MEYFKVFVLVSLATLCSGLELGIYEDKKQMVRPGSSKSLTCHVDMGLAVILQYRVEWIHVSLVNPAQPVETILTSQQTLQDGAFPEHFGIDVKYDTNTCNFTLIVKEVLTSSDGIYKCKATPTSNPSMDIIQEEVHVIVVNDVEFIAMEFDGEESITREESVGLQREEGEYGVTCRAKGFNPSAVNLDLFLGDKMLESTNKVLLDSRASESAGAPRYSASATATSVQLLADHSGKKLKCVAQADFGGSQTLVASVPLTIIALEPVVMCQQNVSARPLDKYVKIKCHVHHANVKIERYSWEIGDTGEIIEPHVTSENYNEVVVENIDPSNTDVTLDLYEVKDWHFDTYYHLDVFTKSGQKFRMSTKLIKLDGPTASATKTTAMCVSWMLCVVAHFFSR